jgi:hypothetical protein
MALIEQDAAKPQETTSPGTTPDKGHRTPPNPPRSTWDKIVSGAGIVVAVALLVIGAAAVYGGNFGRDNVQDRLQPEKVAFPPFEAMTAAEQQELGSFAGQTVDTGPEAEAFARYIGGHLAEVNEGLTYSETSSAAREEGLDPEVAADLQIKADTLFKGETLRSILLNAYGWWTMATIALYVGIALIVAGLLLAILSLLGFRHARRVEDDGTVVVTA